MPPSSLLTCLHLSPILHCRVGYIESQPLQTYNREPKRAATPSNSISLLEASIVIDPIQTLTFPLLLEW